MNWGQKLLLVFAVFALGMIYLAYRCTKINTDLVTKEYYKDELRYQEVIDGTKSANALSRSIEITQGHQVITVQLPGEMRNEKVSGTIWFYCAADAHRDRHIPMSINNDAFQQIDKNVVLPGSYIVKFDWTSKHQHYHSEQPFTKL